MIAGLGCAASLAHTLPLGLHDAPDTASGLLALFGLAALYGCLILLQWRPRVLATWRCWSYAGFYIDEHYTRLTLLLWPTPWTAATTPVAPSPAPWTANVSAANVY
jgi:NAD(P)H-quinone oxidoreductase subunit 5